MLFCWNAGRFLCLLCCRLLSAFCWNLQAFFSRRCALFVEICGLCCGMLCLFVVI